MPTNWLVTSEIVVTKINNNVERCRFFMPMMSPLGENDILLEFPPLLLVLAGLY